METIIQSDTLALPICSFAQMVRFAKLTASYVLRARGTNAEASAGASAFAGAKLDCDVDGKLEWKNPEDGGGIQLVGCGEERTASIAYPVRVRRL